MKGPTPRKLKRFASRCLGLSGYLNRPGDQRVRPHLPARHLLWALIIAEVLREGAFHAIEALVRSRARRGLGVGCRFGDDSLAYFTERLDPQRTRAALVGLARRAKRNKAFDTHRFLGLAVDATGACRSQKAGCVWCHPVLTPEHEVSSHGHHFSLVTLVGTALVLPLDVEPYGLGDCELGASQRLLERVVAGLGVRFADYVVADGLYAGAPFLHAVGRLGLQVVVRLKANLPELFTAAQARFQSTPPTKVVEERGERIELWDAADFDPWESLQWTTVRVLRYRQHKPGGQVVEAYWLTDWSTGKVGTLALYAMAKSRWQIENEGFNEGKTRHGMERIRHHHPNSLLIGWLVVCLALSLERLYRLRHLRRGGRAPRTAIDLVRLLWLNLLAPPRRLDTG